MELNDLIVITKSPIGFPEIKPGMSGYIIRNKPSMHPGDTTYGVIFYNFYSARGAYSIERDCLVKTISASYIKIKAGDPIILIEASCGIAAGTILYKAASSGIFTSLPHGNGVSFEIPPEKYYVVDKQSLNNMSQGLNNQSYNTGISASARPSIKSIIDGCLDTKNSAYSQYNIQSQNNLNQGFINIIQPPAVPYTPLTGTITLPNNGGGGSINFAPVFTYPYVSGPTTTLQKDRKEIEDFLLLTL